MLDQKLVSWNEKEKRFRFHDPNVTLERIEALATQPRDKDIGDFVAALGGYLEAAGMTKLCSLCFKGKLPHQKHSARGCCGPCPLLGEKSCVSKPIACGLFMCEYARRLMPQVAATLHYITNTFRLSKGLEILSHGYYLAGREAENKNVVLVQKERHRLQDAAWFLRNLTKALKEEARA